MVAKKVAILDDRDVYQWGIGDAPIAIFSSCCLFEGVAALFEGAPAREFAFFFEVWAP